MRYSEFANTTDAVVGTACAECAAPLVDGDEVCGASGTYTPRHAACCKTCRENLAAAGNPVDVVPEAATEIKVSGIHINISSSHIAVYLDRGWEPLTADAVKRIGGILLVREDGERGETHAQEWYRGRCWLGELWGKHLPTLSRALVEALSEMADISDRMGAHGDPIVPTYLSTTAVAHGWGTDQWKWVSGLTSDERAIVRRGDGRVLVAGCPPAGGGRPRRGSTVRRVIYVGHGHYAHRVLDSLCDPEVVQTGERMA